MGTFAPQKDIKNMPPQHTKRSKVLSKTNALEGSASRLIILASFHTLSVPKLDTCVYTQTHTHFCNPKATSKDYLPILYIINIYLSALSQDWSKLKFKVKCQ